MLLKSSLLGQVNKIKNTFIIAEAGVNHNGSLERAKEMVKVAARSGANAVKFQTFIAEEEISKLLPRPSIS